MVDIYQDGPDLRAINSLWLSSFYAIPDDPDLRPVAVQFAKFASDMDRDLPPSPLLIEAYRKLFEVRDLIFEATQQKRQRKHGQEPA